MNLLHGYKAQILENPVFSGVLGFTTQKIESSANKASKLAKEARNNALDEDLPGCSMGDVELCHAVKEACRLAGQK